MFFEDKEPVRPNSGNNEEIYAITKKGILVYRISHLFNSLLIEQRNATARSLLNASIALSKNDMLNSSLYIVDALCIMGLDLIEKESIGE